MTDHEIRPEQKKNLLTVRVLKYLDREANSLSQDIPSSIKNSDSVNTCHRIADSLV